MAKKEGDVRTRLHGAALELFRERGYDRTTAAEIAGRAGVTERTFFRYFPDKREVFVRRRSLGARGIDCIDRRRTGRARTTRHAVPGVSGAFEPMLEKRRSYAKPRQDIIAATPALHERELTKIAALGDALAAALMDRDVPELRAVLTAQVGMAAFVHATLVWLDDPSVGLGERFDLAFREMKTLLTESD